MIIKKTHNPYTLKYNKSNQIIRFGYFGIKTISFGKLTEKQALSLERFIMSFLKNNINNKNFKVWNLIIFNLTLTKLSSESRMGKGKGAIYTKAFFFKPGVVLFEFSGFTQHKMVKIFRFIEKKVPFKVSLIKRV